MINILCRCELLIVGARYCGITPRNPGKGRALHVGLEPQGRIYLGSGVCVRNAVTGQSGGFASLPVQRSIYLRLGVRIIDAESGQSSWLALYFVPTAGRLPSRASTH